MQNSMNSDREGTVKRVLVKVGDVIATDQPLIELVDSAANADSNVSHLGIKALFAPANGIVVEVNAKRDEAVKKGAPLFTFEAEGKKTAVTAELDCTVKIIFVQVGRRISAGEPVVTIFQ
jgi:biotin carboxyl carrier protein